MWTHWGSWKGCFHFPFNFANSRNGIMDMPKWAYPIGGALYPRRTLYYTTKGKCNKSKTKRYIDVCCFRTRYCIVVSRYLWFSSWFWNSWCVDITWISINIHNWRILYRLFTKERERESGEDTFLNSLNYNSVRVIFYTLWEWSKSHYKLVSRCYQILIWIGFKMSYGSLILPHIAQIIGHST